MYPSGGGGVKSPVTTGTKQPPPAGFQLFLPYFSEELQQNDYVDLNKQTEAQRLSELIQKTQTDSGHAWVLRPHSMTQWCRLTVPCGLQGGQ